VSVSETNLVLEEEKGLDTLQEFAGNRKTVRIAFILKEQGEKSCIHR
jgi:hypothetical protein